MTPVHEVYLKLVGQEAVQGNDRGHFLAVAARAMRHLLVNYAERRQAAKRGGGTPTVSIDDFNPVSEGAADDVIALHEALDRLDRVSEWQVGVTLPAPGEPVATQQSGEDDSYTREAIARLIDLYERWGRPIDAEAYRRVLAASG